jgi:hypothetical protein
VEDKKVPKKFLNGIFHNTRPVGKPEKDVRTSSGGTHHRSQEYGDGGDDQKTEKKEDVL